LIALLYEMSLSFELQVTHIIETLAPLSFPVENSDWGVEGECKKTKLVSVQAICLAAALRYRK
jgi:hypothetical protein